MEIIDETRIAKICSIKHITEGEFIKGTGWNLNYVKSEIGKLYRINIIGIIVSKNLSSIQVGDKDSIIEIKLFKYIENYNIGDIVLIIGRPREFNARTIIVSEIVKKYEDASILDYRYSIICNKNCENKTNQKKYLDIKKENEVTDKSKSKSKEKIEFENINNIEENEKENLDDNTKSETESKDEVKINKTENINKTEIKEESKISFEKSKVENPTEIIIDIIQKIDDGDGADMQKVIDLSKIENCEEIITTLLEIGEIFNNKPGKLKVL